MMKIKLFFILTLLFFSVNSYCSCKCIIESIEICKEYTCRHHIGNGDFIEPRILGLNSNGLYVYIEKQDNDEMVCHHSKHGAMMEKYFKSVFKVGDQEVDDFVNIASLCAKECFFISDRKISHPDQDDIIKEAAESDYEILSQFNDVKSISFDWESINKIVSEMEKFYLQSPGAAEKRILDDFNHKVVSLDSILYFSSDTWRIWVNGRPFLNSKDLKVHSVTENYVTFIWIIDQKVIKKRANNSQNVYLGDSNVMFTLYPGQKFDLDSLSIR